MPRPVPARTRRAACEIGEHLSAWRKLQGLTVQQVAERAGVTRQTVSRLEHGEPGVGMEVLLGVARAVGALELLVTALDPYESPVGRARAEQALPKRVRR